MFPRSILADDIGFFYALDYDLEALKNASSSEKSIRVGSRSIHQFDIGNHRVYATKMKSGCIETAVSAEGLLAVQGIDYAFSLGPAGGLVERTAIGDWFSVSTVSSYQQGTASPSGFVPGKQGEAQNPLLRPETLKLPSASLASGEVFVASSEERKRIADVTRADLIDMNLTGLLAATINHEVPLVAIRVVSDQADDQAGEDFAKFVKTYDGQGARLFLRWLAALPANKNSPQQHPNLKKLLED